ncbi:MAG: hypothetical protein PHC61_15675 [Chitinivibrionales bacterium]|nr:hypothetical protein [Chitinivibrionales bacterium]
MRRFLLIMVCVALCNAEDSPLKLEPLQGAGWIQFGRIMHSTDTSNADSRNNWMESGGALFSVTADISERLKGNAGLGIMMSYPAMGTLASAKQMSKLLIPFVTQANLVYSLGNLENPWLKISAGIFPFKADPYVQDLGEYLTRGLVYPGFLFSGFECSGASIYGIGIHNSLGNNVFNQDLVLSSETEIKPYFDYSLIYSGSCRLFNSLEIGAGVNFYHLLSINEKLTTPGSYITQESATPNSPYSGNYISVDTANGKADTTHYTFRGIRPMARLAFDPKTLFNSSAFGEKDLILYCEGAVEGVQNYGSVYNDIMRRIPIMAGFNIPTFKILNVLSLEVEWYGSRYRNDFQKVDNNISPIPCQISKYNPPYDSTIINFDPSTDDAKWALYASKTIKKNVVLSAQVANDHVRLGGTGWIPSYSEALTTMKDRYWMAKMAFFF